jgi:hypothetical protein
MGASMVRALCAAFVLAMAVAVSQASGATARTCESLSSVAIPNTTIDSTVVDPGNATTPASCRIQLTATHPPAGDHITIWIWLPLEGWNGRFQGTGGGGFSGGSPNNLPGPLRAGYATGATDTGNPAGDGSFALTPEGRLDWQRIRDNAYLGIHEMTVAGRTLTETFYGKAPGYSYFNGCSAGGRQGLMEAQRYPDDYDGILAGAPAINAPKLRAAQLWGHIVMLETDNAVPRCRFEAATAAAVAACDADDGVVDGVIGDPRKCEFDPSSLVGTPTPCGPITEADATVMRKIWEGARTSTGDFLWYGLARGASFAGLSDTTTVDGVTTSTPNAVTLDWFRYFLLQDPAWDWRTVTTAQWEQLFTQSVEQYNAVTGADNPDLNAFRARGGKLVMWHGFADQLVYPEGTIDYYDRVVEAMGGRERTTRLARLFMAPGVTHCGGGAGPQLVDPLSAVIRWVEHGRAPDTLATTGRPLCPYPQVSRYRGHGSTTDPASFRCVREG